VAVAKTFAANRELLHYALAAMSGSAASPGMYRFGVFEVDLAAGELRKSGIKLRLQEKPFQFLTALLNQPGEIVTREELRQRLWPADTFVDFDHSLNTAVNKLREVLGDSASTPRYVETIARRGYRFIAPVERLGANQASDEARPDAVPLHPELEVPMPHRGLIRGLFALIQIMYLVFYLVALFRFFQVQQMLEDFLPAWGRAAIVLLLITSGVGIVLRCYLLSSVAFDHLRLRQKFERLFLLVLPLDQLWAVTPFLLTGKIGFGLAFAATAALLYVPFSERTLVRMAYPEPS
jgi:DNA-binding winged helix-turn-helix (wHTH) protein